MNECFQKGLRLKKIKKVAGAVGFEPTNASSERRMKIVGIAYSINFMIIILL